MLLGESLRQKAGCIRAAKLHGSREYHSHNYVTNSYKNGNNINNKHKQILMLKIIKNN